MDITGLGAGTGVSFAGATLNGDVTFATLNITGTGASESKGIDLTGQTSAKNVTISDSSAITAVGTGVDLTGADMTGTFRYGDGSNTDADGAASSIDAATPLAISGLNTADGTYNFLDVALTGNISNLSSDLSQYFVDVVSDGIDDGSATHPGTLAGAQASGADVIVLVDTQSGTGQDTLTGTLTLSDNQQLVSFLDSDTILVGGGAPANVLLFGITPGEVTNPNAGSGAPVFTSTGGTTLTLASGNRLEGVVIDNTGGTAVGGTGISAAPPSPAVSSAHISLEHRDRHA